MILGAWFHSSGLERIENSGFDKAREVGFSSARTYNYEHSQRISGELKRQNMSLYAGVEVRKGARFDASDLVRDWRSQLRSDDILKTHELGVPLVAICRGNELREYEEGSLPNWRFTGRIAFALCKLLSATGELIREHGFDTPVTYAMEGLGLDTEGKMLEWVAPVVEAEDIFSVNCYPLEAEDWFTLETFRRNKRFLQDEREINLRLARFEYRLRCLLEELEKFDRPLIISETGLHAGVGYETRDAVKREERAITTVDGRTIVPLQDAEGFERVYVQFMSVISGVCKDYPGRVKGLYLYEWRDNPYHNKVQTENSPVHACFGLCYANGTPKFDLSNLKKVWKQ